MNAQEQAGLIADALRAPSVHNIQPALFRFEEARVLALLEDPKRRLFVGDPEGKDNQKSLGAVFEGLLLALSERGLGAETETPQANEVRRIRILDKAAQDPLAPFAATRASYRGVFAPGQSDDDAASDKLQNACADLHLIRGKDALSHIGDIFDAASMEVLRAPAYLAELLSWMRLSRSHPDYNRDGLNAEHLALSPIEARGASIVLGATMFLPLDAIGLAQPLISEKSKVLKSLGVGLFHRPANEDEFETGRRFYRVWLEIERLGLALCPMSILADVPHVASRLLNENALGPDRKLVTAFRIGRRPAKYRIPARTRLPAAETLISA